MRCQPEMLARLRRQLQLLHRPFLPRPRLAAHRLRREAIKRQIIRRMHRHQLALQMRRQFGHFDTVRRQHPHHVLAIRVAVGRRRQIEQPRIPGRDLHPGIPMPRRPFGDPVQRIIRRRVADKLRQKNARTFDGFHASVPAPQSIALNPLLPCGATNGGAEQAFPAIIPPCKPSPP